MKITLTNVSKRTFRVNGVKFFPGTSKEFEEADAIKLLGYSKQIVKTEDALGPEASKLMGKKDAEIAKLRARVKELEKKPRG